MSATAEHAMRILGLDAGATVEDVRIRRRNLAKMYHPDCAADHARATQHMARVNAAADTLTRHLKNKLQQAKVPQHSAQATSNHASNTRRATDVPKTLPRQQAATPQPTKTLRPVDMADQTLIRMASQSYTKALNKLGTVSRTPKVDVRALG